MQVLLTAKWWRQTEIEYHSLDSLKDSIGLYLFTRGSYSSARRFRWGWCDLSLHVYGIARRRRLARLERPAGPGGATQLWAKLRIAASWVRAASHVPSGNIWARPVSPGPEPTPHGYH
jgi:hypothetical protein